MAPSGARVAPDRKDWKRSDAKPTSGLPGEDSVAQVAWLGALCVVCVCCPMADGEHAPRSLSRASHTGRERAADGLAQVLPRNPTETVDWFAERLGVAGELEHSIGFVRAKGVERPVKKPFPTPCTVRDALTLYCDLCQARRGTRAQVGPSEGCVEVSEVGGSMHLAPVDALFQAGDTRSFVIHPLATEEARECPLRIRLGAP